MGKPFKRMLLRNKKAQAKQAELDKAAETKRLAEEAAKKAAVEKKAKEKTEKAAVKRKAKKEATSED